MISGLLAGSGVGLLVLFRVNDDQKENIRILALLYGIGVAGGIVVNWRRNAHNIQKNLRRMVQRRFPDTVLAMTMMLLAQMLDLHLPAPVTGKKVNCKANIRILALLYGIGVAGGIVVNWLGIMF